MPFYKHYLYWDRRLSATPETLHVLLTSLLRRNLTLQSLSVVYIEYDYFHHFQCWSKTMLSPSQITVLPLNCLYALHFFLSLFTTSGQSESINLMSLCAELLSVSE